MHACEEIIVCKIESGILEAGKIISFNPSGKQGLLKAIEVFGAKTRRAEPGDSVGLFVDGVNGVERGEVISYPENKPRKVKSFVAEIILFSDIEIRNGDILTIRCGTAEKKCEVQTILKEIDPVKLTVRKELPELLKEGSVGEVKLLALQPLCVEKYSELPQLGRFVIEGKKGTSAAGIVLEVTGFSR